MVDTPKVTANIWLRSIKLHTYWNVAREPGTFYPVDTEQDAQTIVDGLKWAVREDPPAKAVREPEPPTPTAETPAVVTPMSTDTAPALATPSRRKR